MEISEIRLQNVETIINKHCRGVRSEFARTIGRDPTSVSRWWTKSIHRKNIGTPSARFIEKKFELPKGWLDSAHSHSAELEADSKKKYFLKAEHGDTHAIPLRHSATLNQQYQLSIINNKKGKLMLLSTDADAYAFQLIGHNPTPILNKNWGLVIEPGTPLAEDEYALIWMKNGEILLRMITYQDDTKLMGLHPISGEQQEFLWAQVDKAQYCYVGIPPSKIMEEAKDPIN